MKLKYDVILNLGSPKLFDYFGNVSNYPSDEPLKVMKPAEVIIFVNEHHKLVFGIPICANLCLVLP